MTQSIIPGCEANPDPTTVINVDPTNKPMKEIPMDELKNNTDNIPESFKQFLASGESVIQTCRELMEENARLRNENAAMTDAFGYVPCMLDASVTSFDGSSGVEWNEVKEWVEKLVSSAKSAGVGLYCLPDLVKDSGEKSEPPADYQTLKDFKGEMDAIHEEFGIPHDVEELRKVLSEWKTCKDACDSNRVEPDELNEKLEELDAIKDVMDNKDISDADDLENYLDEVDDFQKYKKGFEELADFVEKLKEIIGSHGDDIPSTDVYDYD